MKNSNNAENVIGALLLGIAVGSAIGISFVPDKESSTRKKIFYKSDEFTDTLNEKFDEFIETVQKEYEKIKIKVNESLDGKFKTV